MALPMGERVAKLETMATSVQDDIREIKGTMARMDAKIDGFLAQVDGKASKASVAEVDQKVATLQGRVYFYSGAAAVIAWLAGVFGKDVLNK